MTVHRSGVSLIETLVAVALIVVLASIFMPNLMASTDRARARASALVLEDLSDAITTARYDNQDWPARLRHLSAGITTSDRNICGNAYTSGKVNNWAGPYYDRVIPVTGMPIPVGVINDTLGWENLTGGGNPVSFLKIRVDSVAVEDARELNRIVDNDASESAGTIQWSGLSGSGLTTLMWNRTIKGC